MDFVTKTIQKDINLRGDGKWEMLMLILFISSSGSLNPSKGSRSCCHRAKWRLPVIKTSTGHEMDKCLHHLNALLSELTAEATVDQDIDSRVDNCKKVKKKSISGQPHVKLMWGLTLMFLFYQHNNRICMTITLTKSHLCDWVTTLLCKGLP